MARSRSKGGNSGTRYRAINSGALKGMPIVVKSWRGYRKRALSRATIRRIELEREALSRRNSRGRLEEGLALQYLRDVPSVFQIATDENSDLFARWSRRLSPKTRAGAR